MKYYIYTLLLLTITLNVSGCKQETKTVEDHLDENNETGEIHISNEQFEHNQMLLGSLSNQSFPEVVNVNGIIDVPPQSKEIISSFFGGYIKNSSLLIGDKVKKGQALVTLENPEFIEIQQEYLEISEQLTFLKSEYNRQKTLFEEKITSQKNYLKSQSEYNTKLAKHSGLSKKLLLLHIDPLLVEQGIITSEITLYSSIDGSVTSINVSKGTYISPADIIMKIVNKKHIHIELTVFEKDVLKIKEEQIIKFSIPEVSDEKYDAEVHLVGTSIDLTTRTIQVHGHLEDDYNHNFAIGMFVDAAIEISSKNGLAVPSSAIVENDGRNVILVLKSQNNNEYIFIEKAINIGLTYNGFTEIISDNIQPLDKVLVDGAFNLVGDNEGGQSH